VLDASISSFIHQNQETSATGGNAKLSSITLFVPVAASHEILAADLPGHERRIPPQNRSLRTFADWKPGLGDVEQLACFLVCSFKVKPIGA